VSFPGSGGPGWEVHVSRGSITQGKGRIDRLAGFGYQTQVKLGTLAQLDQPHAKPAPAPPVQADNNRFDWARPGLRPGSAGWPGWQVAAGG